MTAQTWQFETDAVMGRLPALLMAVVLVLLAIGTAAHVATA